MFKIFLFVINKMNEKQFLLKSIKKMLKSDMDVININYKNDIYTVIKKDNKVILLHNTSVKEFKNWDKMYKFFKNVNNFGYSTPGSIGGLGGAYVQPSFF